MKGVGGAPVAEGLLELPLMLLTIKEGQGVPSDMDGSERVTVTSGAGEGQSVPPHGATTVYVI